MGGSMRRLLTFTCEGAALGASLDGAGTTGILLVTGGSQTRIGSHRMYESIAKSLSERGYACFRYDRRGVADSTGNDPGYRNSGPDIAAAAAAFRKESPDVTRVIGLGLCDGASALALFGSVLDGLILVNPWLVETQSGEPPAAAIKRHYRQRLMSLEGWRKILTGSLSIPKLIGGLSKIAKAAPSSLAADVAAALCDGPHAVLILARADATAIAAGAEWQSAAFKDVRSPPIYVETNSHTFAKPGDSEALLNACLQALDRL
jgi:exosortase A-associated hydrolase 1